MFSTNIQECAYKFVKVLFKLNLMSKNKIFFDEFKLGLKSYWDATLLILNSKLIFYFIIPLILNILILVFGIRYVFELVEYSTDAFKEWLNFDTKDFWGHQYLNTFFSGLISVLLYVLFFIAYMLISGNIIMILLSPMLSLISEKVDTLVTKKDYPFEFKQLLKDIIRGTLISIRNSIIELILMVLMLFVGFIPVIGLLSPVVMFIASAYFYGFSFLDYTNERNKLSVMQSIKFVRQHKGLAFSNGAVFSIFLLIPFCGSVLAAFISIISVTAATLSVNQLNNSKNKN